MVQGIALVSALAVVVSLVTELIVAARPEIRRHERAHGNAHRPVVAARLHTPALVAGARSLPSSL